MPQISLKYIIDFFKDKSIITTTTRSNILELFQLSDEKCGQSFNDFIDLLMFVIDSNYDVNILSNKKNYIYTIVDDIINYIMDTQLIINKPKIISSIKNNELTQDIILILAYIFDINILIHENNILKAYYFSEKYNRYRNTIIFKVESDPATGVEYYKLLINQDKLIFNSKNDKNLEELLTKEYIIPIGFISNKTFSYNNDKNRLINDRIITEIFVIKNVLEVKDVQQSRINDNMIETKKVDKKVELKIDTKKVDIVEKEDLTHNSDSERDNKISDNLIDYTQMNYVDGLESDDD
jgi:hypothetical protein